LGITPIGCSIDIVSSGILAKATANGILNLSGFGPLIMHYHVSIRAIREAIAIAKHVIPTHGIFSHHSGFFMGLTHC